MSEAKEVQRKDARSKEARSKAPRGGEARRRGTAKARRPGRAASRPPWRPLRRPLGGVSVGLLAVALAGAAFGVGEHVRSQAARQSAAVVAAAAARGRQPASDAVRPGSASAHVARPGRASALRPAVAMLPRSTPLTLAIPSVRLSAPLLGLGMDGKGAAELPPFSLPHTAGWLRDSAAPGEQGTAVILGHVDTTTGPAVFWNLSAVRPGAEVDVNRVDGRTAIFTVDQVRAYPKPALPAAQVYGPGPGAQLRVITCGGGFDRVRHEYTGDVVLFAHLSGSR
jgi:hypothetical protein